MSYISLQTVSCVFLTGFSAIGSFLFGYDSGIIGSVISDSYDEFHTYFKNPDPSITGAVVSVFAGGAFCTSKERDPANYQSVRSLLDRLPIELVERGLSSLVP